MMWNRIEKVLNQEEIMITITKRDFDKRTALGREDLARQVLATKGVDPNNYITISHMGKGCVWTYIFREKL